jgi:hypothetical protein
VAGVIRGDDDELTLDDTREPQDWHGDLIAFGLGDHLDEREQR